MIGIYKIENKVNGRVYIGQTTNIERRWQHHRIALKYNRHENPYLQEEYNMYGINNFVYSVIEECNENELSEKEIKWISFYGGKESKKNYNAMDGGRIGGLNAEALAKVSASNKGKVRTPEMRKRYSEAKKGIKFSAEHCRNIGISKTDKHYTKGYKKIEKDGIIKKVKPDDLQKWLDAGWVCSHKMLVKAVKRTKKGVKVKAVKSNQVWNKGLKGIHLHPETEFKKGMKLSQETKDKMAEWRRNAKRIHKDNVEKLVHINDLQKYLNDGWELGRVKRKEVQINGKNIER